MKKIFSFVGAGKLQNLLILCFSLIAVITIVFGTIGTTTLINNYLETAERERVDRDINLAQAFYNIKLRDITSISYRLATDPQIVARFEKAQAGDPTAKSALITNIQRNIATPTCDCLNSILFIDLAGQIVAGKTRAAARSTTKPIQAGNWGELPIVKATLTDEIGFSSTEVIPVSNLEEIGLADQARIQLIDTDRSNPTPFINGEGQDGFALISTQPIFDFDGDFLGLVLSLYLFNNDPKIVDNIRDVAGIDTVTVFFGDLRVATNVLNGDGSRAIGTRVSQEVHDTVLVEGEPYQGRAFVVNQWYITRYDPIYDHQDQVVGSIYVGSRVSTFQNLLRTFNRNVAVISLVALLLAGIIAIPIAKLITRPIDDLVQANRRLAKGDMQVRVVDYGRGEIGLLGHSFNKMASTLYETQQELLHKEKLASMGQLAAGVAHEINNPLGTILLFAGILRQEFPESDPLRADLDMIISETMRCQKIVTDLLNFSRQQEILTQATNINKLIDHTLTGLQLRSKHGSLEINRSFDFDLPDLNADPAQLQQVFINLFTNAVDAMPMGGRLEITTQKFDQNRVEITVGDTGTGIPTEHLGKLFTPFFTTKGPGKGTGLGLSIAYGIIKMHQGHIAVQSKEGVGTTITVHLPIISNLIPTGSPKISG